MKAFFEVPLALSSQFHPHETLKPPRMKKESPIEKTVSAAAMALGTLPFMVGLGSTAILRTTEGMLDPIPFLSMAILSFLACTYFIPLAWRLNSSLGIRSKKDQAVAAAGRRSIARIVLLSAASGVVCSSFFWSETWWLGFLSATLIHVTHNRVTELTTFWAELDEAALKV